MICVCPSRRAIAGTILVLLATGATLLIFHRVILPLFGFIVPALVPSLYDLAVYGAYPLRSYVTFNGESPDVNVVAWDESCDHGYVLVSPFGDAVPNMGPMILDSRGDLVWTASGFGVVMNLKVQQYQGENYLTFWAGHKVGGIGMGNYHMLNSSYDLVHVVKAASSEQAPRMGDLHDFVITDRGTALLTVYNTTQFDISAMGRPKDGWIVDSLFQEVDIATGELLFEWRASDHFDPAESLYINPFGGYKAANPYDFFHINSIQKDAAGNYLISSRHYHSLTYLDPLGEILWTLGGDYNDFHDLSDGKATSFKWQHDARWVDEEQGILSLFDNGSAGPIMNDADHSLGLIIQIDPEARTVRLLHSYTSSGKALSASQGSLQILPDDKVLVGWGSSAAYSEFTTDGKLLCETHITPSMLFWWERVKTYRAIKTFDWIGRPESPPSAKWLRGKIYVSWNGATEVGAWQLVARKNGAAKSEWQTVDIKDKTGFEDSFTLTGIEEFQHYRVAALDHNGEFLMHSAIVEVEPEAHSSRWALALFMVCVVVGLLIGTLMFARRTAQQNYRSNWLGLKTLMRNRYHRYKKLPSMEMT